MRLTKEQTDQNRQKIIDAAAPLFREKGLDGVALPELMKSAGFTHGGFYNHFRSKEALIAEACLAAMDQTTAKLSDKLKAEPPGEKGSAWRRYVARYLSPAHRDGPESGCTVAALATDAARQGKEVQASFAEGIENVVGALAEHLTKTEGIGTAEARERAMRQWSHMVGALVLSRAVVGANPVLSDEILRVNRNVAAK